MDLVGDRAGETLALLLEVSRSFHALTDVDALLPLIAEKLGVLLDAEACSVILYDAERHELYFQVSSDDRLESSARLKELRFPASEGISGWVLREGQSVLVPDVSREPRFYHAVDREVGTQSRSLICAPLRARSGILGVTQVINKRSGPFTEDDLALLNAVAGSIAVALENARLYDVLRREKEAIHQDNVELRRAIGHHFRRIVGTSPVLRRALDQAGRAAPTRATITILGETGTGKELVARAIHDASDRAAGPFVAVNCAAIPESLLEAELFGYAKGAFTGAVTARKGRFELAHRGTLLLDEIGDLALTLQAKILRVLERGEIQPLGSEEPRQVDVRIVTATNRDLQERVAAGQFRQDLYWRVNVITLELPPLRQRRDDLPVLIRHFLDLAATETGRDRLSLTPDAENALIGYDYPGNLRELENIIRRAAILANGSRIGLEDLPASVSGSGDQTDLVPRTNAELKAAKARAASAASQAVEQRFLIELLRTSGGSITTAARRVGMNRSWLHQLIQRHHLDPKSLGEAAPPT